MERFDAIVVGAGPAGSTAAYRLSRAGARVLLVDRERFPRDKPCGGGLTYRAVRQLPVSVEPVVEDTVDASSSASATGRTLRAQDGGPLILMTQRRRLDALPRRAGSGSRSRLPRRRPRDRAGGGRAGRDGALQRLGGLGSGRDRRRRRQRADGAGARADRPARARRRARGERLPCSRARGLPRPRGGRARRRPGRLRAGSSRRATTSTSASAAGRARARGCARTSSAPAPRTGSPAERLESVRGYRLPMRRPGDRARSGRVLLVGDAAGLVDPLSGDGMYEAFVSARLAAESVLGDELDGYEPALDRELGRSFAASWKAKYAIERFPRPALRRSPACRRSGASSPHFLRGDLAHPGEAHARPRPLRALAPGRDARGLKTLRVAADQPQRGPECGTRPCRGTRRERYSPQGRPAAGSSARRRARPAPGPAAALRQRPRGLARDRRRHDARQALALPRERRARHRLHGRGPAAVPRQRLPPARLDLVRLPRDPERGAELRDSCASRTASSAWPRSTAASCSSPARPARARRPRSRR